MATTSPPHARPLSPHLGIYKPQISSVMSILHRASGVGIALGLPFFVVWIFMLGGGEQSYAQFTSHLRSIVGETILTGIFFVVISAIVVSQTVKFFSGFMQWLTAIIGFAATGFLTFWATGYVTTHYADVVETICAPVGLAALIGWTWAFFYHFCCGIRHLMWDAGWFLSIRGMHVTGWITIILSLLPVLAIWLKIFGYGP